MSSWSTALLCTELKKYRSMEYAKKWQFQWFVLYSNFLRSKNLIVLVSRYGKWHQDNFLVPSVSLVYLQRMSLLICQFSNRNCNKWKPFGWELFKICTIYRANDQIKVVRKAEIESYSFLLLVPLWKCTLFKSWQR